MIIKTVFFSQSPFDKQLDIGGNVAGRMVFVERGNVQHEVVVLELTVEEVTRKTDEQVISFTAQDVGAE